MVTISDKLLRSLQLMLASSLTESVVGVQW